MGRHILTAKIFDKQGRLLSQASNSYKKTHPIMFKAGTAVNKPDSIFLHAEVAALVKLKDWSKAHRIDVIRYMKDGTLGNAKPCAICSRVIGQTAIKLINHS